MNASAERRVVAGPAGAIECVVEEPAVAARGVAVLCHPHPLHGGTMDNKVVQTLARALRQVGWRTVRFNFRGVGGSAGRWDDGRGEVDDALAVIAAVRDAALPLVLGGFSFGGYVAAQAARRVDPPAARLVLVAPATGNFDVGAVPDDTLVVHGDADDVVPLAATLAWARPQALPIVVVPGVGHFFHGQLPLLKSIVVRAFAA
ncbi:alpha/beta hydrolase [Azohydromonas sediminis]|uniref:alpha/beta hydrolase n=1 Tax=Azohydromonas sediminis TaxID=2259674 RepID=UPI000E647A0C|nr:alpha/beta fold hydrolase [Azohydromonas sediminis]